MNFKEITIKSWAELDNTGSAVSGYKSILVTEDNKTEPQLHLFVDESKVYHFAIKGDRFLKEGIKEPNINGLKILFSKYQLDDCLINSYIDICCHIDGFLPEFTEVVREIADSILHKNNKINDAINTVIDKWKAFWASPYKKMLSEDEQIGLICELIVLKRLCEINPDNAINKWTGPLGEKYDFNFTDWNFEIKGTRKNRHIHTINGIDQLKPVDNKNLAVISFLISTSNTDTSLSLQSLIENIISVSLQKRPHLVIQFNKLLSGVGYSPIDSEDYRRFRIQIIDEILYIVDEDFPKLTSDKLITALDNRITAVRYDIFLDGVFGKRLSEVNLGNYFY